ncbi:unnamed protein product, partial [marine sediment metagenome]
MLEEVLKRVLRAVFGDDSDISIINPMPVTDRALGKGLAGVINAIDILGDKTTTIYLQVGDGYACQFSSRSTDGAEKGEVGSGGGQDGISTAS